jgi:hypothetical protein
MQGVVVAGQISETVLNVLCVMATAQKRPGHAL